MPGDDNNLVAWALGTFHASILIVVAVLILHAAGGLGSLLSSLNTPTGLALFAALWATTTWSARRTLRDAFEPDLRVVMGAPDLIWRAIRDGALNGVVFLACLAIILAISAVATGNGGSILIFIYGAPFIAVIGTAIAAVIGALIGLCYLAIDLTLIAATRALLR